MRTPAVNAVDVTSDFVETRWQGHDLDRALATRVLGEAEATVPLGSCFALVEREGGVAALATLDGASLYGSAAARAHATTFTRAVSSSRPHRAYGTSREEGWAWLTDAGLAWIACEPAGEGAMLVAGGTTEESRDELLVRLPRLARACGVVVDQLRANLSLKDTIEDILITLGKHYHLIRPLRSRSTLFFYVALDRSRANLAMARIALADVEKDLQV